jgi:hypothetical protein
MTKRSIQFDEEFQVDDPNHGGDYVKPWRQLKAIYEQAGDQKGHAGISPF